MANTSKIGTTSATSDGAKWLLPFSLFLIATVTVAVYWPVLRNDFITFDDDVYVTGNLVIRQGLTFKGLLWSFSKFHEANWFPLTWLSHMLDVELFAMNPAGHHATNLLIHTMNSALLCALLHRLTGRLGRSTVVALLFAIHPLHVESVAWVAERKDVLSTLFWLMTMWVYCSYARQPSLKRYLPVTVFFALGLMSKQMLVTLPFVLLLMDYWPLKRFAPHHPQIEPPLPATNCWGKGMSTMKLLLVEKIPLFLMSAAASLVTLRAQDSGGALAHGDGSSVLLCVGNALISYVKYIRNMFWPADLALFYPFEPSAVTVLKVTGAVTVLAMVTGVTFTQSKKRPYLVFGWFWYLITLLPVIGFIRIGSQALADRYTYVPLIGLFLIIAWGGSEIAGKWRNGLTAAAGVTGFIVMILASLTFTQIHYWQNSYVLYTHALAAVERNWLAHNNIGILLAQQHRNDEALFHFRESVRLNPNSGAGFRNLGNSLQMAGKNAEAIEAYIKAVSIDPKNIEGHFRLGYAYLLSGATALAYQEYSQLLRLDEALARNLLNSIEMQKRR